jgi:hypothetical protein
MRKFLTILLVVMVVGLLGYFYFQQEQAKDIIVEPENDSQVSSKLYTDADLGYSINLPQGFKVEANGEYSKQFLPDTEVVGMGPTNFIYVSVVPPEMRDSNGEVYNYNPQHFAKLIELENIGDSVNLAENDIPDLGEWFTYTVVAIEDIDNGEVKNFENTKPWEFPLGTTENRFIYGTQKNIYVLGYYTGGEGVAEEARIDPRVAYEVIKSFSVLP